MRLFIFYFAFTGFLISQENLSELNTQKWVDSVYNSLSLEEKIGQLFINWVSPEQSDYDQIEKLVVEQKIGGLIFSIGDPFSHVEWMNKFQSKAKTPLLIAMDAEWGPAMRLDNVFAYPWNMTLGAIQDNKIVQDISKRIAEQNKLLGIHYNFSPVVDVNSNPINPIIGNRSFGEDPENVYQKAKAYIEGHDEVGIITSLKHFPGHGDTSIDSHNTLPEIKSNLKRLNEIELYPFKKLINDNIVSSIMSAHILYPSLDKKYPSSISKKIVKNLLKEKLGFSGIIVTDAFDNVELGMVTLYLNDSAIISSKDAPYEYTWITTDYAEDEQHTIWAKAEDAAGNLTQTNPIRVLIDNLDNINPTGTLIFPYTGQTISGEITIIVEANDNEEVAFVNVYIDGDTVATLTESPYTFNWDTSVEVDAESS